MESAKALTMNSPCENNIGRGVRDANSLCATTNSKRTNQKLFPTMTTIADEIFRELSEALSNGAKYEQEQATTQ